MKTIYSTIDKTTIPAMPRVTFDGKIIVVQSQQEADKAVRALSRERIVGIDTETKPSFRKGASHQVALLQVSTSNICFLFRLNFIGLCDSLVEFLSNDDILKVGLSLNDDIPALNKRKSFRSTSFLDLQNYVPQFGIKDMSLQKIYANLFGERISKAERLSNWEADVLSEKQKMYASIDAWACLKIYNELENLRKSHNYNLIVVDNEIQTVNS